MTATGDRPEEVLYRSTRTCVVRVEAADGSSAIRKEALGPNARSRTEHEAAVLERLAGLPGVPELREVSGPTTIVIADRPGTPLADLIAAAPNGLPPALVLEVAIGLAQLLAQVHRRGVIHKEINPRNILLCGPDRSPMLLDFELASTFVDERPSFTHANSIVGTLAYLAPEQTGRTGQGVDHRADLYSLGVTLYEISTGRTPFGRGADDALTLIHDHLARLPVPVRELRPELPAGLSDVIAKLLEKEPDQRYQSGDGLAHDLRRLHEGAFFVLGQRDFPLRLTAPSRLIARAAEIDVLTEAFERAAAGHGRGILVTGEAGVGKTALIDQLRPIVAAAGGWLITGKFDRRSDATHSDAVTQATAALARLLLAEPETALIEYRSRLLAVLGDKATLIATIVPEFALLLGVPPGRPVGDLQEVQDRAIQAGLDLFRVTASPARPVVMVLDDLQWASSVPLGMVEAILTGEDLPGLLVVGAYRDRELGPDHPLAATLARWRRLGVAPPVVRLENLHLDDLGTLLGEMLRIDPDEARPLAEAVGARTGGNPSDTVELLNTLRAEGALSLGDAGWRWDAATIRRHVGEGDAGHRLIARIDRLPGPTAPVLEVIACLGVQIDLPLLATATALTAPVLRDRLGPALEDGLLVLSTAAQFGAGETVRFRHDRVQQAVRARLDPDALAARRLTIARRLAAGSGYETVAAEQYLAVLDAVTEPAEQRQVAQLFHTAVAGTRVTNPAVTEKFLAAATSLLAGLDSAADAVLRRRLRIERHAALCSLRQFTAADTLFGSIEQDCPDPLDLVEAGCGQIAALTNQARTVEAVALGLDLLRRLGLAIPPPAELTAEVDLGLEALYRWVQADERVAELARPEVSDVQVIAIAEIIKRLMPAAFFGDQDVMAWLTLQCHRLWAQHGPCRALVGAFSHAGVMLIVRRQDYRTGYLLVKRVLAASQERGYEPETSHARFVLNSSFTPWFEPLGNSLKGIQQAVEGLLSGGDPQTAVFAHHALLPLTLDSAPNLESYLPAVEAGLALAERTGNDHARAAFIPQRQFARALRGETGPAHGFTDDSFDERAHLAGLGNNLLAEATFHITRALAAALFGDEPTLLEQSAAAIPLLAHMGGAYPTSRAYLLRALALAGAARNAGQQQRGALIAELDIYRDWLAARAADTPGSFGHLLALINAERAWAVNDFAGAMANFDFAMQEAGNEWQWHQALITERAGTFHLTHGHQHAAGSLLALARDTYADWGASAKVQQLQKKYPFLRPPLPAANRPAPDGSLLGVSSDTVDLLAVLKASQALGRETEFDRLRARVVEVLTEMTGATTVTVLLWSEDDGEWVMPAGPARREADSRPAGRSATIGVAAAGAAHLFPLSAFRYAERTRLPLLVADATRDDRFSADPYLADARVCSLLVVPILSQGRPQVILVLQNRLHRNVFSPDRLDAIMLIAGQLAVSFDNALARSRREQEADRRLKLLETLRERERLLETLLAIQRDISHRVPLQKVLDAVTLGASTMLDDAFVALVLVDPIGDGEPRIPSVAGRRSARDHDELVLSVAIEAVATDHLVARPDRPGGAGGVLIAAPVHASGEIIGSLVTSDPVEDDGLPERQELLSAFAEQVSLALNDANTLEAIREASYDSLTGLASRPLFLDRLKRALLAGTARETEVSVLFIDLDRFKAVNDSLGHSAGDDLLAEVAGRLRGCIRDSDTGARLGGDEFAVLLEETHGDSAGLGAAERIAVALRQPFRIAGQDIFVTASIGVAHGAAAGLDAAELLDRADLAMYRAKKAGSRRAVVFEPQMHVEARERLALQSDLLRALAAGEFRLQFQPLLALEREQPIGMEALLRWPHPEKGLISPAAFIPLAEETGAIVELGRWVLIESCRQVARWRRTSWPQLELSINVSGRQLLDGQLAADVAEILAETGLPARALTLELTETVLMDDPGNIMVRLSELKALGVQLAIDDFGTGYSSLSYLRRFPVDKLKIDKSFIDHIADVEEDLAIVRTVVDLARILQLQTTAEGIETQAQLDLLRDVGCEVGQGYLFARPLDAEAVPAYFAGHQPTAEAAEKTVSRVPGR